MDEVLTEENPVIQGEYQPFPIESLPCSLQKFSLECAQSQSVNPDFYAPSMLPIISGIIGNVFEVETQVGGFIQPLALWMFLVADSGSGKSPALSNLTHYLQREQSRWIKEHRKAFKEWKAEQAKLKPKDRQKECPIDSVRQVVISNTTQEAFMQVLSENPRGLLLLKDELSGWVKDFNRYSKTGGDVQNWLECHDGGSVTINRKTSVPPLLRIDRATVSICGGVQPGILARVFGQEHMESGLVSRFVFVYPPPQALELQRHGTPESVVTQFNQVIQKLLDLDQPYDFDGFPKPHRLKLSHDAFLLMKFFVDEGSKQATRLNPHLKAAWSKFVGRTARIAGVLHVLDWASDPTRSGIPDAVIQAETMHKAIEVSTWFWRECQRVYRLFGIGLIGNKGHGEDQLLHLVTWIDSKGGEVEARDLQRSNGKKYRYVVDARHALDGLEKAGYVDAILEPGADENATRYRLKTKPYDCRTVGLSDSSFNPIKNGEENDNVPF